MKKSNLLVLFIIIFIFSGCTSSSSDINEYLKTGSLLDTESKDVMPKLSDLGDYISTEYSYTHTDAIIFEDNAVVLNVTYDDENYKIEKEKIDEAFIFYVDPSDKERDEFEKNKINDFAYGFDIESYTFRIVSKDDENTTGIPKSFGMIATSDEKKSIAYLYFYDSDLDTISYENEENIMARFVKEHFDYEFE